MASRIVLFGATGYTGRLVAAALAGRGARPLLAGRNAAALNELAASLGGLETAVADVARPESLRELLSEGDVLISTVGPFTRLGAAVAEAAIARRAIYLDSTGEGPFIRRVFEHYGPRAELAGAALLTAFAYDWVPGNLAAALALADAGEAARRVEVGYFADGMNTPAAISGGTRASLAAVLLEPGFVWRDGRLQTERVGARTRTFDVAAGRRQAISAPASEHYTLPRIAPRLRDVDVYLGWFGNLSRAMQAVGAVTAAAGQVPGSGPLLGAASRRLLAGSSGGPSPEQRRRSSSRVVAIARSAGGEQLARVELAGPNTYTFSGDILAWAATTAAADGVRGTGALGPVDAFGLDRLEAGCAEAGMRRV